MARPPLHFSPDTHEQVQILAGAGWPERDLALLLGIARETLRKCFEDELTLGRLRCRAEVVEALYRAASAAGNVSAQKAWLQLTADPAGGADETPAG